ncbi:MAG: hypothetical protein WED10_11805 [Brumimicrobium sp.]
MSKKIKIILSIFLISFFYQEINAQSHGILGRKFLGKAVIINGIKPLSLNIEGEYFFHRKMSITVGLGINTVKLRQNYYIQGEREFNNFTQEFEINNDKYELKKSEKDTRINSGFLNFQFNYYFLNHLISAPNGFYLSARGIAGIANMNSKSGFSMVNPLDYVEGTHVAPFKLGNIFYNSVELGFGIQKLINNRWTIDGSVFYNLTKFNSNGSSKTKDYTGTIAKNYGSNITTLNNKYNSIRPSSSSIDQSSGISFYLKIGYFIF